MILSVLLLLIALLCPLDLYIYAAGGGDPFYVYRAQKIGQKKPFFRDDMSILSGLA